VLPSHGIPDAGCSRCGVRRVGDAQRKEKARVRVALCWDVPGAVRWQGSEKGSGCRLLIAEPAKADRRELREGTDAQRGA